MKLSSHGTTALLNAGMQERGQAHHPVLKRVILSTELVHWVSQPAKGQSSRQLLLATSQPRQAQPCWAKPVCWHQTPNTYTSGGREGGMHKHGD